MDAAERKEILSRYVDHSRRFDAVAKRRGGKGAEVIPFSGPLQELEQEPTAREIEVLQLISDGLVNREIGVRLFLSEETVKRLGAFLSETQDLRRAFPQPCGNPSTGGCGQDGGNGSYDSVNGSRYQSLTLPPMAAIGPRVARSLRIRDRMGPP